MLLSTISHVAKQRFWTVGLATLLAITVVGCDGKKKNQGPPPIAQVEFPGDMNWPSDKTACTETFTLNPDGSGKVHVEFSEPFDVPPHRPRSMAQAAAVKEQLNKRGIETWSDLSFSFDNDIFKFAATGYFKDINEVRGAGFSFSLYSPKIEKREDGGFKIVIANKKSAQKPKGPEPDDAEKIKQIRKELLSTFNTFRSWIRPVNHKRIIIPPKGATVSDLSNLKKHSDGALSYETSPEAFKDYFAKTYNDGSELLRLAKSQWNGSAPEVFAASINKGLFGSAKPIEATISGDMTPRFDYAAESAAARKKYYPMLVSKGVLMDKLPPEKETPRLGPVLYKGGSSNERDKKSMPVYIYYTATLDRDAIGVSSVLRKITDEHGNDLTPPSNFGQNACRLDHSSKRNVKLNFLFPGEFAKGNAFKEIIYEMAFYNADEPKTVDLGFEKIEEKAKGKRFGATITSVEHKENDKGEPLTSVNITLSLPKESRIAPKCRLTINGPDGKEIPTVSSYSSGGLRRRYGRTYKLADLPAGSKVMFTYRDNIEVFKKIVLLKDVPLSIAAGKKAIAAKWKKMYADKTLADLKTVSRTDGVKDVQYSPDGRFFGLLDNAHLILFDAKTREERWSRPVADGLCLAFSKDGAQIAFSRRNDSGGEVTLLQSATGKSLGSFKARAGRMIFDPAGKRLAAADGQTVSVYNIPDGKRRWRWDIDKKQNRNRTEGAAWDITPDWRYVLADLQRRGYPDASPDKPIPFNDRKGYASLILQNWILPDGSLALVQGRRVTRLIDLRNGKTVNTQEMTGINPGAMSRDRTLFLCEKGLWNVKTGTFVEKKMHLAGNKPAAFSADNKEYTIGSNAYLVDNIGKSGAYRPWGITSFRMKDYKWTFGANKNEILLHSPDKTLWVLDIQSQSITQRPREGKFDPKAVKSKMGGRELVKTGPGRTTVLNSQGKTLATIVTSGELMLLFDAENKCVNARKLGRGAIHRPLFKAAP